MKNGIRIAIVVLLALAVAATFVLRDRKRAEDAAAGAPPRAEAPAAPRAAAPPGVPPATATAALPAAERAPAAPPPRLLELGSMRCQACLEMAKVLDALRASQGPKLRVDFIDVFEHPEATGRYGISLIPTQILFDGEGREIYRHTGFFSHDDILAKFREAGVKL